MKNKTPNCKCSYCEKDIYKKPCEIKKRGNLFCDISCYNLFYRRKEIKCTICNTLFSPSSNSQKFCSRSCSNISRRGISYDGSNSKNNANKSKKLKFELALERGGVCEKCGEKNYSILQTHHIVQRKDGGSDKLDNLELLCPNCHYSHHFGYSEWNPIASV